MARELAEKLRMARISAGLTQAELAKRIGCARSTISDYERGKTLPDAERLAELASALGLPLGYFYPAAGRLLEGGTVRAVTVEQLRRVGRRGRPRAGGVALVSWPEWLERLGGLVWLVCDQAELAEHFGRGAVIGVVRGEVVPGCPVLLWARDGVSVGRVLEEGGGILTADGRMRRPRRREVVGSVVVVVQPGAVGLLRAERADEAGRGRGRKGGG